VFWSVYKLDMPWNSHHISSSQSYLTRSSCFQEAPDFKNLPDESKGSKVGSGALAELRVAARMKMGCCDIPKGVSSFM